MPAIRRSAFFLRATRARRRVFAPLRRHPRVTAAVLVSLLLVVLVVGADATRRALDARRELLAAAQTLQATRATLSPLLRFDSAAWPDRAGYERMLDDVARAETHLQRADERLGYLRQVAALARPVPRWGRQIAEAPCAVDLGLGVTSQASVMLRTAEPLFLGEGSTAERAREVLVVRHAQLDAALDALEDDAAEARRLREVQWRWPMASAGPLLDDLATDLDQVHAIREMAAAAATGLDPLLGFDGPRTYIVLGQNEQEIRPTGGFIGTMGVIVIERGRLAASEYRSSYDFDPARFPRHRPPPEALHRYMGADGWFVRDANWDADFPRTAERIRAFLKEDQSINADSVIAVDTRMMRLLLDATGPLAIEGIAEPLTEANFLTLLEEEIFEPGGNSLDRKRQLLQPILRELITRVQDTDAAGVPPLIAALRTATQARNLQMYSREPRSSALIARLEVGGVLAPQPGRDFVAVVDSNISYDKIQIVIRREITYLARADGRVDLLVRWTDERSTFAGPRFPRLGSGGELWDAATRRMVPVPGVFGNYARIYLPPGTTVEHISGFDGPPALEHAEGYTELGGLVLVRDGQTATLRLTYVPGGGRQPSPSGVDFWKQGGQERDTLRVFIASGRTQLTPHDGAFNRDLSFDLPARSPRDRAPSLGGTGG